MDVVIVVALVVIASDVVPIAGITAAIDAADFGVAAADFAGLV